MNEHRVPSNRETLSWFKDNLKNGKASEEMFKTEALSFFNLSPEMGAKDKRSFKREIEHFADMHQSLLRKWLREFLAENGGLGKNNDTVYIYIVYIFLNCRHNMMQLRSNLNI